MRTVSFAWMLVVLLVAGLAAAVTCYLATPYLIVSSAEGLVLRIGRISGNIERLALTNEDMELQWTPVYTQTMLARPSSRVRDLDGRQLSLVEIDAKYVLESAYVAIYNGSPIRLTQVTVAVSAPDATTPSGLAARSYVLVPETTIRPLKNRCFEGWIVF